MVSKLRQVVVFALAGTLAAVQPISDVLHSPRGADSADYPEVPLPAASVVELDQEQPSNGESNGSGSQEDGNSYPAGQLRPEPSPLEMFKRGHRVSGLHSTVGRSHEKHASGLHAFPAQSPGLQQTGIADRCIRSWLSVVAPPVKPHAPPHIRSFLA